MTSSPSPPDSVRVEAFLADSVSAEGGKLHAQGAGWNMLLAEQVPTVHGRIGLALLLHVAAHDGDPHELEVRLEDPHGDEIPLAVAPPEADARDRRIRGEFRLEPQPPDWALDEQIFAAGINLEAVPFEQPGRHRFVVSLDGADAAEVAFAVIRREDGE